MSGKNHIGTIGSELDTIPDLIDPHIGWRAWYLEPHGEDKELVLRAYFKENAFWLPGGDERQPMIAECHGAMSKHVEDERGVVPTVPVEGCQCGIYASSDPDWTLNYATTGLRDRVLQALVNSITPEELAHVDYSRFSQAMSITESVDILTDLCRRRGDVETAVAIEEKRLPYGYAVDWAKRPWFQKSDSGIPPQAVFGTVNLWGKVIPHDTGWRASHAYPKDMYLSRQHYGEGAEAVADDLAERYGVPVTIVDDWADVVKQYKELNGSM